ncbi:hypothetical protein [Saccharopolyspora pogona]|uniref:hypothetical protein n=1 Tax=Saccharopolyspora pogona TaxID=333966 RepID=UPI0016855B95|nr:hypothetical protein [Saccharopolyspora pogona]
MGVRALFRRFWPFLRRDRLALSLAGALLVVSALMDTAGIWMFMVLTDDALATGELAAFWAPAAAWASRWWVPRRRCAADSCPPK